MTLVFVHSPLVGPLTWRAVAGQLAAAGRQTVVPDITDVMAGRPPYHPAIAEAVREAVGSVEEPVVLIGHSGAGSVLPTIAATVRQPVRALLYVDAVLPHPGKSWLETAPANLVEHLNGLAVDEWLPPWHKWFPPESLAQLMSDEELGQRFTVELSPLPLAYFREPAPPITWSGPYGYLMLSDAYRAEADSAAADGAPVLMRPSNHLAMLTIPDVVTEALDSLLAMVGGD